MKLIQYIGNRASKTDNVAGTGLTWAQEQIHSVSDDLARKLLAYPSIWREVDPIVPLNPSTNTEVKSATTCIRPLRSIKHNT